MDGLLILLALTLFVTVGHFTWVAIAAIVRFLRTGGQPRVPAKALDSRSVGSELLDLEVTTRTIRQLLARGGLDKEASERVEHCLEARRHALQPIPVVRPAPSITGCDLGHLEEMLGEGRHPRDLSPYQRREALACYRRLNDSQRAALKPPVLLAVARLLEMAGMTTHTLNAYRRLLDEHPRLPNHSLIALEAARIAMHHKLHDLARRFLNQALGGVLPEAEYEEVQSLLLRLDESVHAPAAIAVVEPSPTGETPVFPAAVRTTPVAPSPHRPPTVLPAPARPRRSLTNVMAAFMEERNILWGELAGGMLIVGCSIALVITLWHSLEQLPYFPFLIFASITAALFGAGEYTLHHWKLESTSRGLLVIALLLVPLNLLVLADPSLAHAGPALGWSFKTAALLLAVGMVRLAGRDLIGVGVLPGPIDRRWWFVVAIVGAAGSQLLMPSLLDDARPLLYLLVGYLPVACHVLASGVVVAGLARARARSESHLVKVGQAHTLFVFLGLSSFGLCVALG